MFQYRIFPKKKQVRALQSQREECRWLYNHLLEKRRDAYEQTGKGLSCYEQQATYPMLKQERPSLKQVHSQVLQHVAVRIDLAMKAFQKMPLSERIFDCSCCPAHLDRDLNAAKNILGLGLQARVIPEAPGFIRGE